MLDSDASTAKTLTLVAIVLQLIFFAIGVVAIFGLLTFLSIAHVTTTTSNGTYISYPTSPLFGLGIAAVVFSIFFLIGLVWILLDYFLVYKKLVSEKIREAEMPSLVLGIVQLIFGGVISGILLIIAYVKIRDSLERSGKESQQATHL